jgi:S1-C subfamily serine protease
VASLVTAATFSLVDDREADEVAAPIATVAPSRAEPASLGETDLRSLLDRVRPAVVRITVEQDGAAAGEGTGFIVASDGVIVTNAHVVGDADQISVALSDGTVESAELLGAQTNYDVAVIKIDQTGLATLSLGDSTPPTTQVGDGVIAVGNALGLEGELSVTTGIVSALDRTVPVGDAELVSAVQTDAAINPGNSGGPLLNTRGEVIGINTAIAPTEVANNVGFAISISSAKPIIEALRAGRTPHIPFLGVSTETVDAARARAEGLISNQGAIIVDVVRGAAADDAGIRTGDVVLSIDGVPVTSRESLLREIRLREGGDEVVLEVERDRDVIELRVALGELPSDGV